MNDDRPNPAFKTRPIPLRLWLIVPFVLQIVGSVGLVGYLSYRSGQEAVEDMAKPLMAEIGDRIQQNLINYLDQPTKVTQNTANLIKLGILDGQDLGTIERYFWKQLQTFNGIGGLIIADEQKDVLTLGVTDDGTYGVRIKDQSTNGYFDNYLTNNQGKRIQFLRRSTTYEPLNDAPTTPWYQRAKQENRLIWDLIVSQFKTDDLILIAANGIPFYDQNNKFQGVLGSSVSLARIGNFLGNLKIGTSNTGQALIIDRSGLLIATSTKEIPFIQGFIAPDNQSNVKKNVDPSKRRLNILNSQNLLTQTIAFEIKKYFTDFKQIKENTYLRINVKNKFYLVQIVPLNITQDFDWLSLIIIPESDFMQQIDRNKQITLFLCLLTLIIATAAGIVTSDWITKPIKRLSQASSTIAGGEFNQVIESQGIDELDTLFNSFNLMSMQLQTSFETLENRVLERTKELVIAKEKAEIANQAKSTFIANMSHELRSPLNAILGFSQLILRTKQLPKEQYENAGIIHRSGEYLLTLINNILDFAKIEAGKTTLNLQNFDLYKVLDDLEDMLHLKAFNAGLELIFDRGENLPRYLYADGVKLRQVLLNILGNAIKFTDQGTVILRVHSEKNQENENYTLSFRISDTGKGIAPEELGQLFEAFQQTESGRESQEGTGLGLVISRQFVQLMGGDITIESELGKGTTCDFSIQVQLGHETQDRNIPTRHVLALAPDQPTYKILTVDDKPINRELLIKLLVPLGFEVKEASHGREAIDIWEVWEPHLIFMDMRMPIMDGYEATKYIKSTTKGNATAVIALTASVLEEEKAIVLSAGCDDFLRKPFKEQFIFEALTKHLGVQYIYENIYENLADDPLIDEDSKPLLLSIDIAILMAMPEEWRSQLSQAAIEGDSYRVMELIETIPDQECNGIKILKKFAQQFKFDEIAELLDEVIKRSKDV